jgi:hypothetical protein
MRFIYVLALVLTLSLASAQWYNTTKYICPAPIEYRIGEIADSFGLNEKDARAYILQSEAVWESAVGEELFTYNPDASFTINFVFDERQATANAQTIARDRLDNIAVQNESFRIQIADLQQAYENQEAAFKEERDAYDTDLAAYNERVRQMNDRGGVGPVVFAELEAQSIGLEREADALRIQADILTNLAEQVNQLSAEGNRLIETYNQEVQEYNSIYGQTHEFTQGDYQGGSINVYKFSNQNELVSVLAHEFGHALGIEHVEEPSALMYYLLDDELLDAPELADGDIAAYELVCKDQGIAGTIRGSIRQFISKF